MTYVDETVRTDVKSYDARMKEMKKKSIQDEGNSKIQKIAGELYPGKGIDISKIAVPIMVAAAGTIMGIAGHMANVHSMTVDIKATIDREINDEDNFVLDQVRLSEMVEEKNYTTKELYEAYKEAKEAIKNKEEGTNVVHFHDKDIEIDQTLVNYLLMENKDSLFSRSNKTAEALTLAGMDLYYGLEHELKVEKNNNAVR